MKLKLPDGTFRAYLFDCDGTIADSMPLHYKAWKAALSEWSFFTSGAASLRLRSSPS